jgi:hypothetical protein
MTTQLPLMRGSSETTAGDVGDEAAALVHLQPGFFSVFPLGNAHFAADHAGFHAHIGNWFGEHKGSTPGLAILAGLGWGGQAHVTSHLLLSAALVNGRKGEATGKTRGGRAAVNPGQLKSGQRQSHVLGADNESALFRLHEGRCNSGAIKGLHHLALAGGPLVGVALAGGYHLRHGSPCYAAGRLNQHLQVKTISKTPLNLAYRISWESEHGLCFRYRNSGHK